MRTLFLSILTILVLVVTSTGSASSCENLFEVSDRRIENVERLILQTGRLEIRPLTVDMAEEILRMQQDPLVARVAAAKENTLPAIRKHIQDLRTSLKQIRTTEGMIDLAIVQDGIIIGNILANHWYVKNGSQILSTYVIGYQLDKASRGNGFATEVVERFVDFLFKEGKADEVQAFVHLDNDASSNVLRKSGFAQFESKKKMNNFVLTLQSWRRRQLTNAVLKAG